MAAKFQEVRCLQEFGWQQVNTADFQDSVKQLSKSTYSKPSYDVVS